MLDAHNYFDTMTASRRIQGFNTTVIILVAVVMIVGSVLLLGLLEPGHRVFEHQASSPTPAPTPIATRNLLGLRVTGEQDVRTVMDYEMRKRGYAHLPAASNAQFLAAAKGLFPNAKKPLVTDVYAKMDGGAHWMVVASANAASLGSDWDSGMVVKKDGSFVFSNQHKDLHSEIRQAVFTTMTSK